MGSEPQVIELMLASSLKSVDRAEALANEVSGKAGFEEDDRHRIGMAVHEAVINAIRHGNKEDASKRVRLVFRIFPDRLEIEIRDQGPGFELARLADPLEADNLLKTSGRGIFLVRSFVDEFRVRQIEGAGTEVTLVKRKN
ncbi:MAG: ATP-binding protein [Terriglobia bacterium]